MKNRKCTYVITIVQSYCVKTNTILADLTTVFRFAVVSDCAMLRSDGA